MTYTVYTTILAEKKQCLSTKQQKYPSTIQRQNYSINQLSALNRCTVQQFTEGDDTRCCVNTIFPPEDGHVNDRNMSRIIV